MVGVIIILVTAFYLPIWDTSAPYGKTFSLDLSVPVDSSDNSYTYLPAKGERTKTEISALEVVRRGYATATKALTPTQLAQVIIDTESLVKKFKEAVTRDVYQCPNLLNQFNYDATPCDLGNLREMAALAIFHTEYHLGQGDVIRARALLNSALKLSRLVAYQDQPTYLDLLVSYAVIDSVLNILDSPGGRSVGELQTFQISTSSLSKAIIREYVSGRSLLTTKLAQSRTTYWPQPQRTQNLLTLHTDNELQFIERPCGDREAARVLEEQFLAAQFRPELGSAVIGPNAGGRILIELLVAARLAVTLKEGACAINERVAK